MVDDILAAVAGGVETALRELVQAGGIKPGHIIVIGTSTSEVLGRRIGTAGATDVAKRIFAAVEAVRAEYGFLPAYQCCEHLNRALVVERSLLQLPVSLEEVSVVPVPKAGGSMAAYSYTHLHDACVVEAISAHAGIDIGETLIGMHLKRVAVPFRPSIRAIGQARLTAAFTRPKLIGGSRAVYEPQAQSDSDDTCS
jgi:uncharacterized protein (TIGR01440 family)